MKLHILSDLHNEFEPFKYQPTNADIVVLAGDIAVKTKGVEWALATITDKPVIYVLGNHEYYNAAYPKLIRDLKMLAKNTNVHVLENTLFTYQGINIFGCTLWTDFKLNGDQRISGYDAEKDMTDYKKIRKSPKFSKLRAADTLVANSSSISWLEQELDAHQGEKNVVISHHAPSERSVAEHHKGSRLSPAYASHLDYLVEKANLWIHGHMHESFDYQIGECRVVCNPRGYAPYELNPEFKPQLVIEV